MLCTLVLNSAANGILGVTNLNPGSDYEVLTISIDPDETAELAAQKQNRYVKTFGKRKKFDFPVNERDSFNTIKLLNALYRADELNKKVNVFSIEESKRLGRKNEKISKLYRLK